MRQEAEGWPRPSPAPMSPNLAASAAAPADVAGQIGGEMREAIAGAPSGFITLIGPPNTGIVQGFTQRESKPDANGLFAAHPKDCGALERHGGSTRPGDDSGASALVAMRVLKGTELYGGWAKFTPDPQGVIHVPRAKSAPCPGAASRPPRTRRAAAAETEKPARAL